MPLDKAIVGRGLADCAEGTEVTLDDEKGVAAMEIAQRLYQADIAIDEVPVEENYFAEIAAGNVAMTAMAVWYRGFGIEPNEQIGEQALTGGWLTRWD